VNLMSDEDSPEMPGLLYEAQIPDGLKRPVMGGRNTNGRDEDSDDNSESGDSPPSALDAERYQQPSIQTSESDNTTEADDSGHGTSTGDVEMSSVTGNDKDKSSDDSIAKQSETAGTTINSEQIDNGLANSGSSEQPPMRTAKVPFAIAKLYKLPLTSPPLFGAKTTKKGNSGIGRRQRSGQSGISTSPLLKSDSGAEENFPASSSEEDDTCAPYVIPDGEYTPAQKQAVVEAILPKNGATIVKQPGRAMQDNKEERYGIIGSDGTLKRVLFVDRSSGKVFEEMQDDDDNSANEGRFSSTIKLGLGDFIFYSVLVAKSAQYSFPCFISSFLVILAGLGGTLVLLAVYKHALPALPISIFLAVGFYVLVRFMAEPWIHAVLSSPFYV